MTYTIKRTVLLTALLLITVLSLSACSYSGLPVEEDHGGVSDECATLEDNFDNHIETMDMQKCKEYKDKELMVGGTLKTIETTFNKGYGRYEHTFIFEGAERTGSLRIHTFDNKTIPYKIGIFYVFDLTGNCPLMNSAASSGAFHDPDLDALEALEKCN